MIEDGNTLTFAADAMARFIAFYKTLGSALKTSTFRAGQMPESGKRRSGSRVRWNGRHAHRNRT